MSELSWMQKEEIARQWCSKENNSIKLTKDNVRFWDEDNHMQLFEFDITSHPGELDKREIIGMVKSSKYDNSGNAYASILGDCFLLNWANADKKYMVLTDQKMYDYFIGRCEPLLDEIMLVYLDPDEHKELLDNS